MIFADGRLEFLVDDEFRRLVFASPPDVGPPVSESLTAFFNRSRFFVSRVIHFTAKGIERGHGIAFGSRQHDKGERQI